MKFKAEASLSLTNYGGIEIMLDEDNEIVYYRWNFGTPEEVKQTELFWTLDENKNDYELAFDIGDRTGLQNWEYSDLYYVKDFMKGV